MFLNIFTALIIFFASLLGGSNSSTLEFIVKQEIPILEEALSADKAAVFSDSDRVFLYLKNEDDAQAIASITKLMTAIVFLETKPNFDNVYKIVAADQIEGGKINLFLGDELTLKNLFLTSLVASDNGATIALVRASGLSEPDFIALMNARALELGLVKTKFSDPIGLSEKNVSSAREVIILFKEALKYKEIVEAISLPEYRFETLQGREKLIESTDQYLLTEGDKDLITLGGKTGYTQEAGYCFVGAFIDTKGNTYYATVLNSINRYSRFTESKNLIYSLKK